jgi:hypothetical protein
MICIKGLNDRSINFAQGTRKTKLNWLEKRVRDLFKLVDKIANTSYSSQINNRVGVLTISNQFYGVTKLLYTINGRQPENYLNYVRQLTIPKSLDVIIQGVPCPNIDTNNVEQSDLLQLINLITEFNKVLQDQAKKRNFDFLDLHKLTDRGDGFSNGLWHMDQHHLSPSGMIEAWRRYILTS